MKGDAAADRDANGGDFFIAEPNSREWRSARPREVEIFKGLNGRLFEIPHEAMYVAAQLRAQIKDRIDHQLPGAVISHIAAASGTNDRNFLWRKHVRIRTSRDRACKHGDVRQTVKRRQRFAAVWPGPAALGFPKQRYTPFGRDLYNRA